ncbi:MAG: SpoIID/LytB domain-containing protein [Nitrospinota bacterium]
MRRLLLALLFLLSWAPTALGAPSVRVALMKGVKEVAFGAESPLRFYGLPEGIVLHESSSGETLKLTLRDGEFLLLGDSFAVKENLRVRALSGVLLLNGRPYRGLIDCIKDGKGSFLVVNELKVEDYLRGVLSFEMGPGWPLEALKAQSVASRTFILLSKGEGRKGPYHLESTFIGQVYGGALGETPATDRAVAETQGEVLFYGGKLARTYFHSMSDGRTEDFSSLFGEEIPYLRSVPSPYDREARDFSWRAEIDLYELGRALSGQGLSIGRVREARVVSWTPAGRVREVLFRGSSGEGRLKARELRRLLGWNVVKSTAFRLYLRRGSLLIEGRGSGHGLGLSQWGARGMAERGASYRDILRHYYPGTELRRLSP